MFEYLSGGRFQGFVFLGFFQKQAHDRPNLGDLNEISLFCRSNDVNQIFCALPSDSLLFSQIMKYADHNYIRFAFLREDISCVEFENLRVHKFSPSRHQYHTTLASLSAKIL